MALSEYPGVPGSDYTNANFIRGASGSNAYIACQGPLPHTVNDFWRMVVECEVQVIVMACNEQEAGKHKCEKYWKDESDESSSSNQPTATFGKYDVTLLKSREICPDFLVRTMRLRWKNDGPPNGNEKFANTNKIEPQESCNESSSMVTGAKVQTQAHRDELDSGGDDVQSSEESSSSGSEFDEERTVCQFHYSAWPDHGIPLQVKPLLEMVRLIRDCQASETLPVLIHCSAGCGRTGTICAIDFIWGLLRTGKLSEDFSLYSLVRDMRKQRIAMVQTVDQYVLVHRAVKELFLEQLKVIDAHPYENVDGDGHPISIGGAVDPSNESVVPDYETIFVKGMEEHRLASSASSTTSNSNLSTAVDFDRILNQKMIQAQLQRQKQNHRSEGSIDIVKCNDSASSSDDEPPNPPPKQRNMIDAKTIDSRQVIIPDPLPEQEENSVSLPSVEPVLFEPPISKGTPDKNQSNFSSNATHIPGPQKLKKGNLRLTQTEDGAWKLQQLESELPDLDKSNDAKKSSPQSQSTNSQYQSRKESKKNDSLAINKKAKNRKDKKTSPNRVDDTDSPKAGELLRKPSIKKIRAFFNKDKQQCSTDQSQHSSPSTSSSSSTTCLDEDSHHTERILNPIENDTHDRDIALAISKLPKIEQITFPSQLQMIEDPSTLDNMLNSKSVPNSLDRRACNSSSIVRKSSPEETKRFVKSFI